MFHIRVRVARENRQPLTQPALATGLLNSAQYYHEQGCWFCHLFLLMPDHWHALLSFPPSSKMIMVIGRWKAWQRRTLEIQWQENFFDHRVRGRRELQLKADYILNNPVVKGLCPQPADWPWKLENSPFDNNVL